MLQFVLEVMGFHDARTMLASCDLGSLQLHNLQSIVNEGEKVGKNRFNFHTSLMHALRK